MNYKKSRVSDLFRKMDKVKEGFISREDLIDGFMRTSKFIIIQYFFSILHLFLL